MTKGATGLTDKESAIILYSVLKQGCWSETSLPFKSEWRHWYYHLTNDPRSEPLCSQENKRRNTVAFITFCQKKHYFTFLLFSQKHHESVSLPWEGNHLSSCGQIINLQYNLVGYTFYIKVRMRAEITLTKHISFYSQPEWMKCFLKMEILFKGEILPLSLPQRGVHCCTRKLNRPRWLNHDIQQVVLTWQHFKEASAGMVSQTHNRQTSKHILFCQFLLPAVFTLCTTRGTEVTVVIPLFFLMPVASPSGLLWMQFYAPHECG